MKANSKFFLLLLITLPGVASGQSVQVEQVKQNRFVILLDGNFSKHTTSWNSLPDSWSKAKTFVVKGKRDTVEIPTVHPIVKLADKRKSYYGAPRAIALEGAVNFRDLGGYATRDGRQVKWGKIYRSADISKLSDKDVEILSSLNIKMVCDLRGEKEAAASPDKQIPGADRILLAAGSENVGVGNFTKYLTTSPRADSMIRSFYTRTDHLTAKYKPMFDQLLSLEEDRALMFHCTAGKDRTGVGAALILYALGVSEEDIITDYELTNEYRKALNERTIKLMTSQGVPENAARIVMAAKKEYLKAAFESIAAKYGSLDNFLTHEIGLGAEQWIRLKSKFLY